MDTRTRWFLVLALTSLPAGCGSKGGGDDTSVEADTDTDTDTDSDFEACAARWGIAGVGSAWTWDIDTSGLTGTNEMTVAEWDATTGVGRFHGTLVGTASGYDYSAEADHGFRCDGEGLWMLDQQALSTIDLGTTETTTTTVFAYDAPVLTGPFDFSVGTTWTTHQSGTATTNGTPVDFDTTVEHELVAEESVTVPAGTWTALRDDYTGSASGSAWLVEGVGSVRDGSGELVSHTP